MRILMVIVCLLTVGFGAGKKNKGRSNNNCENVPVNKTVHVGSSVIITCKYPRAEKNNIRYFCRKNGNLGCTTLISEDITQQDKFSLTVNKRKLVFTVNISSVEQEVAGTYRCAMKRVNDNSTACLTEIQLYVLNWDDITPVAAAVTADTKKLTCNYSDENQESEKFLCKGDNPSNCEELIRTTKQERDIVNGRFHIRDNQRKKYFYVDIRNLTRADSGTYWCGAGEEYTKIQFSVAEKPLRVKKMDTSGPEAPRQVTTRDPPPKPDAPEIAGIVVGVVLFLVALILLIVFRRKIFNGVACCAGGDSSEPRTNDGHNTQGENNADHQYEEIQLQQQQQASAPLSLYATVNPPAEPVHYASVNIHNNVNSVPNTDINGSMQPPESTLYSTVNATQAK